MPSFSSYFHLPSPRGAECATQEQATAKERKCLRREKAMKHIEHQKRIASLSDDDDDDNKEGSKGEDKDLAVL